MEDRCVTCGHGGHRHWMGDTGSCEIVSCDCKQMVYPNHESTPRMDYRTSYIEQLKAMSVDSSIPIPARDHLRAALRIIEQN